MSEDSVNPTLVELQIDRSRLKRASLDLSAGENVQEVVAAVESKQIRVVFVHLEPADGATVQFYSAAVALAGVCGRAANHWAGGLALWWTEEGEALGALVSGGAATGYILYIES